MSDSSIQRPPQRCANQLPNPGSKNQGPGPLPQGPIRPATGSISPRHLPHHGGWRSVRGGGQRSNSWHHGPHARHSPGAPWDPIVPRRKWADTKGTAASPQSSHAGWHCCFNSPGFILYPSFLPCHSSPFSSWMGSPQEPEEDLPMPRPLATLLKFQAIYCRNDRMGAPSLPGTALCPESLPLSLQEGKVGIVGVGIRGRASGPASNYLRKSQGECPRQRLLIRLLAHALLSFPEEPSCVMMSQRGPWGTLEAELTPRGGSGGCESALPSPLSPTPCLWPHAAPPSPECAICSAGAQPMSSVLILKPEFKSAKAPRKSFLLLPLLAFSSFD